MNSTVSDQAAEREPTDVTPTFTHALRCDFSLMRNPTADAKCSCPVEPAQSLPAYAAMGRCPCGAEPGYLCENAAGEKLGEPHPERMPAPADDTDIRTALAADLDRMGLTPDPITAEVYAEHFPEWDDRGAPAPVEAERRTVSLEVLGAEMLRFVPPGTYTELLVATTVGIVLRVSGELVAVPETDVDWPREHRQPADVLAQMLQQARFYASDAGDAELLMPTPAVLAALSGSTGATFWTGPVPTRADAIEPGWLVLGFSGPDTEEPVDAKTSDCGAETCPWPGDCTALSIGGSEPIHFADWTTLTVRIPAAVTR